MNGMQLDPATMQRLAMMLQQYGGASQVPGAPMMNTATQPPMPPQAMHAVGSSMMMPRSMGPTDPRSMMMPMTGMMR